MAVAPGTHASPVFDLKSASLTLVTLVLRSTDLDEIGEELQRRFGNAPQLFDRDPLVIDLCAVAGAVVSFDVDGVVTLLKRYKGMPLGVRGGRSL
jgi:septum site-determining protein MinC